MKTPRVSITLPRNEWDKIAAVLYEDALKHLDIAKRPSDPDTLIIYLEIIKKKLRLARNPRARALRCRMFDHWNDAFDNIMADSLRKS